MIRIRRVYNTTFLRDRDIVAQVMELFRVTFPDVRDYAESIPKHLDNPVRYQYKTVLLAALGPKNTVSGFALIIHFPLVNYSLLDFIVVDPEIKARGIGSALYEAVREYTAASGSKGLFLESLPDDSRLVKDPRLLKENQKRLKFYEHYGVFPITGTAYETPIDEHPVPYLLYDPLPSPAKGAGKPLSAAELRKVVRTILTKKYGNLVSEEYIEMVVKSVKQDPVQLRPARYMKTDSQLKLSFTGKLEKPILLICSNHHGIHHVKERGYVERPARVDAIRETLLKENWFAETGARHFPESWLASVHNPGFIRYLRTVCMNMQPKRSIYPYVFPIRNQDKPPKDLSVCAGYYCIDTFTPLNRNAYGAARAAVDVALTCAEELRGGRRAAYALLRPPGHHAETKVFGGFCYFNNAAIAANYLSKDGPVAVLDIDFHHGNGTQDIFYRRRDVLTLSIHGKPETAYPYFSGYADEKGEGEGAGFNINYPLKEEAGAEVWLNTIKTALGRIARFKPLYLVVSLGFDTMRGDPTGSFGLGVEAMQEAGALLTRAALPLLIVQEGGYSLRNLRTGSHAFFRGIAKELLRK
ncbi:MAG: GNAT family N-acetyltransferase [Spirochaetales bacterium]|nr:MAG: GNAT family N-acetyltransferase [Spirochaetales bacterium]